MVHIGCSDDEGSLYRQQDWDTHHCDSLTDCDSICKGSSQVGGGGLVRGWSLPMVSQW